MTAVRRIVHVSLHRWDDLHRRAHSLASAFLAHPSVERVLFVDPEVDVIAAVEKSLAHPVKAVKSWRPTGDREAPGTPRRFTPLRVVPFSGRIASLRRHETERNARKIEHLAGGDFAVVTNAIAPSAAPLLERLARSHPLLFDWTDDFFQFDAYANSKAARAALEKRLLSLVRLSCAVTAVNENVARIAREYGADPVVVPNGADVEGMSRAWREELPCPGPLRAAGRRPILAYTGVFTSARIDIDLLVGALDRLDGWEFVALGDREEAAVRGLGHRKNVTFLPRVPYDELPAWYRRFTVCALPHADNAHTRGNDPLKIYEYLAAGRPVVATPVAGTGPFASLITLATDGRSFAEGVIEAAENDSLDLARRRAAAVALHSWQNRAETILSLLEEKIAEKS